MAMQAGRLAHSLVVGLFVGTGLGCGPRILLHDDGAWDGSGEAEGSGDANDGEGTHSTSGEDTGSSSSGETDAPAIPTVEQTWEVEIDTPVKYDAFCDVAVLLDGTLVATGTSTDELNPKGGRGWMARIAIDGELLDFADLPQDHAPLSLSVDPAGRLFIVGTRGIYPDNGEHFFTIWDFDTGPEWMWSKRTDWGFSGCHGYLGLADSESLTDGMLVARYEDAGSTARIFDPLGAVVAEMKLGGTIDGFHTVVSTGPSSFAALGERAAASPFADDWAVLRYDSAGTLLWEETGPGRPEELLLVASELWHVVSGPGTVNRHTVANGAFVSTSPPGDGYLGPVASWADQLVALTHEGDLIAYTTELEPAWQVGLDLPSGGSRRLVTGSDGALYVLVDSWITRVVQN
jgi:hypothetical protein